MIEYKTLSGHREVNTIADLIGQRTRDYIALELVAGFTLLDERYRGNDRGQDCLEQFYLSGFTRRVYSLFFVSETDCYVTEV